MLPGKRRDFGLYSGITIVPPMRLCVFSRQMTPAGARCGFPVDGRTASAIPPIGSEPSGAVGTVRYTRPPTMDAPPWP